MCRCPNGTAAGVLTAEALSVMTNVGLARSAKQEQTTEQRSKAMQAVNPQRILRNHLAQEAIEAAEKGDYSVVKRLHAGLVEPYKIIKEYEDLSALPPEGSEELEISCSS